MRFALLLLLPSVASAFTLLEDKAKDRSFKISAYAQPFFRAADFPAGADGFGVARARLGFAVQPRDGVRLKLTLKTLPVDLYSLELQLRLAEGLWFRTGRFKPPTSKQELTSDSRQQFASRSMVTEETPGRPFGASVWWERDLLRLELGAFNSQTDTGKPDSQLEDMLFTVRAEVRPLGKMAKGESDLRPAEERSTPKLSLGGSFTHQGIGDDRIKAERRIGVDLAFAWHGVFVYGELLLLKSETPDGDPIRDSSGWNAQIGSMVPLAYLEEHLELAARVTQWDHDDDQAARDLSFSTNWHVTPHKTKVQATYNRRTLTADKHSEADPVDSLYLQLTIRI
jgi:hypothetical protein